MSNFPVYRKYTNNKTYFKILSENEFEELQFIGDKPHVFRIVAQQYPEKLRIMDMLACKDNVWESISEETYNAQATIQP
jgi:hypothetical protein